MGGGDLNMKKSWHPLLLKNQERVWLEEKKALEERKKLEQLRKEKEEERQLQELQRLQEEQTGKKRTEKLEWMYTTPATGTSQNPNDLEDYLLGKKRVDKILTGDENAKIGASHKNFIAVQNANSVRDIAAKIREDPLLAIKQQEQAAYHALMTNPLRLRELQERTGVKTKRNKEEKRREKEERKKRKHERKHRRDRYSESPDSRSGSRSPSPHHRRSRSPERRSRYNDRDDYRPRSPSPRRRRRDSSLHRSNNYSRSPARRDRMDDGRSQWPRSDESDDNHLYRRHNNFHASSSGSRRDEGAVYADRHRHRDRRSRSPLPRRLTNDTNDTSERRSSVDDRAARLAAMTANASAMTVERQERLTALLEKEKAELEAEELERAKSKGMGNFLNHEQKKVFGGSGGLEERIRRGRGGLVLDKD